MDSQIERDEWNLYGRALLDYLEGRRDALLVAVREDGRQVDQPVSTYFSDASDFGDQDRVMLDRCNGEVLDVGAGAGRHSLVLQNKGFSVHSIDVSKFAVEVMKRRGVRRAEQRALIDTHLGNYDTILMMTNGIGIVKTLSGLERFLARTASEMRRGARLLLDTFDFRLSRNTADREYFQRPVGADVYCGETRYKFEYRGESSRPIPWLFIDEDSLVAYAQRAGFDARILAREAKGSFAAELVLTSRRVLSAWPRLHQGQLGFERKYPISGDDSCIHSENVVEQKSK